MGLEAEPAAVRSGGNAHLREAIAVGKSFNGRDEPLAVAWILDDVAVDPWFNQSRDTAPPRGDHRTAGRKRFDRRSWERVVKSGMDQGIARAIQDGKLRLIDVAAECHVRTHAQSAGDPIERCGWSASCHDQRDLQAHLASTGNRDQAAEEPLENVIVADEEQPHVETVRRRSATGIDDRCRREARQIDARRRDRDAMWVDPVAAHQPIAKCRVEDHQLRVRGLRQETRLLFQDQGPARIQRRRAPKERTAQAGVQRFPFCGEGVVVETRMKLIVRRGGQRTRRQHGASGKSVSHSFSRPRETPVAHDRGAAKDADVHVGGWNAAQCVMAVHTCPILARREVARELCKYRSRPPPAAFHRSVTIARSNAPYAPVRDVRLQRGSWVTRIVDQRFKASWSGFPRQGNSREQSAINCRPGHFQDAERRSVMSAEGKELLRQAHSPGWDGYAKYVLLTTILAAEDALLVWCVLQQSWWAVPPLVVLVGISMHGQVMAFHEAAHRTLVPVRWWNDTVGVTIGLFSFASFTAYLAVHKTHHAYLATERDEELWPFVMPTVSRRKRQIAMACSILIGAVFRPFIVIRTFLRHGSPIRAQGTRLRVWAEYGAILVFWCVVVALTSRANVLHVLLIAYFAPVFIAGNIDGCRACVEHVGMTGPTVLGTTRSVVPATPLGRLLAFNWFNIDYHGVHHFLGGLRQSRLSQFTHLLTPSAEHETTPYPNYRSAFRDALRALADPRTGSHMNDAA